MRLLRQFALLVVLSTVLLLTGCPPGHGVHLTWNAGVYQPTVVYRVYRASAGAVPGPTAVVAVVAQAPAPTWTDSTVQSGQGYVYWLTAYDAATGMESSKSNTFTAVIP